MLPNGLTLIVHEDHQAPIVAVNVWYHVGSKNAYASKVRALSVCDLEDAARTVIHPENLIWVIVGDRSKLEAGIKELNLGELHLLSPEGQAVTGMPEPSRSRASTRILKRSSAYFRYLVAS